MFNYCRINIVELCINFRLWIITGFCRNCPNGILDCCGIWMMTLELIVSLVEIL